MTRERFTSLRRGKDSPGPSERKEQPAPIFAVAVGDDDVPREVERRLLITAW